MRNHGLLTAGRSVAEAFKLMFNLERSCRAQIAALSTGQMPRMPDKAVCEKTARQYESHYNKVEAGGVADIEWSAFLRLLDKGDPGYAA